MRRLEVNRSKMCIVSSKACTFVPCFLRRQAPGIAVRVNRCAIRGTCAGGRPITHLLGHQHESYRQTTALHGVVGCVGIHLIYICSLLYGVVGYAGMTKLGALGQLY